MTATTATPCPDIPTQIQTQNTIDRLSQREHPQRMVYGTLLNHHSSLAALDGQLDKPPYAAPPKAPILFIKTANTHSVDGAPIPMPAKLDALEIGATLGIVIGQTASRVTAGKAMDYVAGYVVVNDVSIPHASYFRPAVKHKCLDGFCPISAMTPRDAVADPAALTIQVFINGTLAQTASNADLIRPLPQLLADVTAFMTLSPGDILLIGTAANPPRAKVGDEVRIDIPGVGQLSNVVVAQSQSTLAGETA